MAFYRLILYVCLFLVPPMHGARAMTVEERAVAESKKTAREEEERRRQRREEREIREAKTVSEAEQLSRVIAESEEAYRAQLLKSEVSSSSSSSSSSAPKKIPAPKLPAGEHKAQASAFTIFTGHKILWVPVVKQVRALCGLYAFRNTVELVQALTLGTKLLDVYAKLLKPFDLLSLAVEQIKAHSGRHDWLMREDIAFLVSKADLFVGTTLDVDYFKKTITVIDYLSESYIEVYPNLAEVAKNLRMTENMIHGFILSTAKVREQHAHWISIVVHKMGSLLTYYIADSLTSEKYTVVTDVTSRFVPGADENVAKKRTLQTIARFIDYVERWPLG